jgi:hypothetical protein
MSYASLLGLPDTAVVSEIWWTSSEAKDALLAGRLDDGVWQFGDHPRY